MTHPLDGTSRLFRVAGSPIGLTEHAVSGP